MTLQWMTASQAAERWGVSLRYVQRLLAAGRVPDVQKYGRSWMIPPDAKKPDVRQKERPPEPSAVLPYLFIAWEGLLPGLEPEAVSPSIGDAALRSQYRGEIAYLRGDFAQAKFFIAEALAHESTSICASLFSMILAVTTNDFDLYSRVEAELRRRLGDTGDPRVAILAETALAAVAVSMFAPEMAPGWLKEGDFSRLPAEAAPFALYLRVKYLQNLADYPQMFTVAQTMLALCRGKGTVMEIYQLLMCAAACVGLGYKDRAREYLLEALARGMPHGFITPFAENVANLTGLVEECVAQQYPEARSALLAQWQDTWKNWAVFHNRFARDNATLLLTLREFRIATLAAGHVPYAQIAERECLSVGRVRNIVQEIYGKLLIRSRDELAALVLWAPKKS